MNAKPATALPSGRGDPFGLSGTVLDARYEVVDLVARGGFGVVYRALHAELRKTVAIKVLKTPGDFTGRQQQEFLQRFTEEARTVARLDHPNIVRVLDFGTSVMPSGTRAPWMALEWLAGVTLEADFNARIETGTAGRTATEALGLMYPIIEAVAVAHEEGVVHRDIKPGNVMIVTGRRGDQRLKLLDFGIAKVMAPEDRRAADRAQTLTQVQAFSPDYAAPEQVSGLRTGPWTDVHALALLLSEMLTAAVPFEGNDAMEMCASVLAPRRPTPGALGVDVGPWEAVFARALSLRPSDRYENAGEFLSALMDHLPPDVDLRDAQLGASPTGAHRLTPTQSDPPRGSSQPPLPAPLTNPMLTAPTDPPPAPTPSFPPPAPQYAIPTERLAPPRAYVAPVLVLIGLGFGCLVATAVILLLRPPPAIVRATNQPALVAAQSLAPVTAPLAVPTSPVASPVAPPVVDASAVDSVDASVEPPPVEREGRRHRSHRHRDRPHRSHRRHR